ncbi:hypothetical protein [Sphingomonas bacterium]|uniref:hypothetical protein n=1 Tax=Sphingomonas bacterium TaxID=1895847 RepID=UPI001575C582|nr:hypothetical protein [Sphingomonas bacterium]
MLQEDAIRVEALLAPGERVLRETPVTALMPRAGIVAIGWAVPAFAVGFFPLRAVILYLLHPSADARIPWWLLLVFVGFGLLWLTIARALVLEPRRLARLWPHITHVLTDRRFLAIDRRTGVLWENELTTIWTIKTFSPFGRLTLTRRGASSDTGRYARNRDYDGVADVAAVAQEIADMTGVPVGVTPATVKASIAQMPPGTKVR